MYVKSVKIFVHRCVQNAINLDYILSYISHVNQMKDQRVIFLFTSIRCFQTFPLSSFVSNGRPGVRPACGGGCADIDDMLQ